MVHHSEKHHEILSLNHPSAQCSGTQATSEAHPSVSSPSTYQIDGCGTAAAELVSVQVTLPLLTSGPKAFA